MPVILILAGLGTTMLVVERLWPGHRHHRVAGFHVRACLATVLQALTVLSAGLVWDRLLAAHQLWSIPGLGVVGGGLLGYLVITFVYYWWHRWRHSSRFLWRWCHQLHHSPHRLEVLTSFYKHPLEFIANALLSSLLLYFVLGLSPEAVAIASFLGGAAELFYHWNVATPHWLGYIIQRPESHRVHHELGRHDLNFSDLPLWDMLFGTFHNPKPRTIECGFSGQAETRVKDMLLGREVSS